MAEILFHVNSKQFMNSKVKMLDKELLGSNQGIGGLQPFPSDSNDKDPGGHVG